MIKLTRTAAILCLSLSAFLGQAQDPIASVEAENGQFNGVQKSTTTGGYSGTGYVTGFDQNSDYVEVTLNISQGDLYRLEIGYNSSGNKTQYLYVNDEGPYPILFETSGGWSSQASGSYRFKSGKNTLKLQSGWGYMDVDNFVIYPALDKTYNVATSLIDPEANEDAVALYDFMLEHFGTRVISGQTNDTYEDLADEAGYRPLMRTFDMQSYTEGYTYAWDNNIGGHTFGAVDNGQVDAAIAWHEETGGQGIVNWQWHWHSPSGGTAGTNSFYSDQTSFDVREAVKKGTDEYDLIIRDIDAIAVQLKKLSDAGVPMIWRPLHEAGGAWFWWGAQGAEPCLALWDIVYDRLQNHHGIHNLIWSWSTPEHDWYPGNDKVDFIGYDSYPGANNYVSPTQMYDQLYEITGGEKIIAMTENGPIPDLKNSFALEAPWSMFMSWSNLVFEQNQTAHLREVYAYWRVLVFDQNYNLIVRAEEDETIEPQEPVLVVRDDLKVNVLIYPNPADQYIKVRGLDHLDMWVYDLSGRLAASYLNQSADRINVSQLRNGQYLVIVRSEGKEERLPMLILHR